MTQPVGAMWPGAFETIVSTKTGQRYEVLYLPDLHNEELQMEGKAPVYYWLPNGVRVARQGDTGDFKFNLIHFEGVMSENTTIGVSGASEVAGGVLGLTVTCAPPLDVLEASHKQLTEKLRADVRKYWGWRVPADPQFAPVAISDCRTHMSNLSPRIDGSVPSALPNGTKGAAPSGTPGAATKSAELVQRMHPRMVAQPRTYREGRDNMPSNLDAWYMRIEGDGPGSINPAGENAYTALCGSLPAAILWAGFHGTYSPVVVSQTLNLKVWSENLRIKITGNWDRVFSHFSAAAAGRAWWFSADIKVEFNNLRISGGIKVEIEIDGTNPGADKLKEEVDKRVDLIVAKFTEAAKARIFDPAPPEVKPAEAPTGGGILSSLFGGFGGGFALKYRRDETQLDLTYDETRQERYNLSTTISSSLEGFYNEIKADPDAEKKYFTTLYLEDWDRKITHNIKPVVNWPDASRQWVGEPVAFIGVQIGYPSARGDIQWQPHAFQSTDTGPMTTWQPAVAKKNASDVVDPPSGWTPDISYIKRSIHFSEPPTETENPFVRCFVEKNVVELDPGPNGTATNDLNIEVRADSAGKLDVGPIQLNVNLETPAQTVEIEFQALGQTDDGNDRAVTKFVWHSNDQEKDRYWTIFTGQKDFLPRFKYRCHVVVKGGLFTKGMEWIGPWTETAGNGPLVVSVPTAQDPGVQTRSLVPTSRPAVSPPVVTAPIAGKPPVGVPKEAPATIPGRIPAGRPPGVRAEAGVKQAQPAVRGYELNPEPGTPATISSGKVAEREAAPATKAMRESETVPGDQGYGDGATTPPLAGWTQVKPTGLHH